MLKHSAREANSSGVMALQSNSMFVDSPLRDELATRVSGGDSYLAAVEPLAWIAGALAHDLNNLLTTVLGNVSMALLDVPRDSATSSMLDEAARAATEASRVTRQLHEFARRQPTNRSANFLNVLIDSLSPTLERLVAPGIGIRTLHEADAGAVCIDPHHFEMVLTNLVRNASDAMPGGGVLVIETSNVCVPQQRIAHGLVLAPGNYVAMRVIDQGNGMGAQVLERLFVPFFTTKPKGRGSGLGLAAVRASLRQAGGGIDITSVVGVGTTVTVYYPRMREPERSPLQPTRHVPVVSRADGPATILLVEDEPALRTLGQRILERLGYCVLVAESGNQALEIAEKDGCHIDLLFTDVIMPGMNGRELAERLCQTRPDLKVLFTSGYTERIFCLDQQGDHSEGASRNRECLGKPYKPEVLAARVKALLDAGQVERPKTEL